MRNPDQVLGEIQTRGDFRGLSERASPASSSENASDDALEVPGDHPIWEVWDAIRSAWPGPTANWPDAPPMAWLYAIDGLSADAISEGVRTMVRTGGEFPPSAPTFRAICDDADSWEHERIRQADRRGRAMLELPPPPRDPAVNASGIAKLREALK